MDIKKDDEGIMELEHAIGYSGKIVNSVYLHPNGRDFLYIAGGCIVVCNIDDPHQQTFLRAHDDQITALSISHNGKLLASGTLDLKKYLGYFIYE
jgi:WD40 repeat protein